jgi:hypothetical protein
MVFPLYSNTDLPVFVNSPMMVASTPLLFASAENSSHLSFGTD